MPARSPLPSGVISRERFSQTIAEEPQTRRVGGLDEHPVAVAQLAHAGSRRPRPRSRRRRPRRPTIPAPTASRNIRRAPAPTTTMRWMPRRTASRPDAVVLLLGVLAELAHRAEHRDRALARAGDLGEGAQRRRHRVGTGVVGVVDDAHALGAERLHAPALRDLDGLEPRDACRRAARRARSPPRSRPARS